MALSKKAVNKQKAIHWKNTCKIRQLLLSPKQVTVREHDLNRQLFQYWKKRIGQSPKPTFVELRCGVPPDLPLLILYQLIC